MKRSAHLIDPELKTYADSLPDGELTSEVLPYAIELLGNLIRPLPEDLPLTVSEKFVPGPEGAPEVRVLVFTPTNTSTPRPGYLYMHGGGMVMGSPEADQVVTAELAVALGCSIVSVDYRLAPQTRHPGPIEDCYAALFWMYNHAEELGIDPNRIAIGGESAGGGLAASLSLLARDRGEVPIIFQRIAAPMLDDRTSIAEPHPYNGEYTWTAESNRFGWTSYLGHEPGIDGVSYYASAARAEDLTGLPATFITVGALDLFLDESMVYAQRLIRAGVPTELHVYPGAFHGSPAVNDARVSKNEQQARFDALHRAFYG
jgi:acetyl esterase/lipase